MSAAADVVSLAHAIQLAVAPVFLLSGIGALLAVLTNRLSRVIDRARSLEARHPQEEPAERRELESRLATLSERGRLISRAILLVTICALLVCTVVAALFMGAFFGFDASRLVGVVFILAMFSLIGGLVTFLREIFLATRSLRIGPPAPRPDG
jgi:hypothetical protein